MLIIACVDDDMGMMFNHRRQSRDRVLIERVLSAARGNKLWMNRYTAEQFSEHTAPQICVSDSFMAEAGYGEYCFIEDCDITPYLHQIEKIILYRWNRRYPSDHTFPIDLSSGGWKLAHTAEFAGSSHDRITEEIYTQ